MSATPLPPPRLVEADHRLSADVPCNGCGYNLRGLATDGICPECAHPITPSLERYARRLSFGDPAWLLEVSRGLVWLAVALTVLGVVAIGVPFMANLVLALTAPRVGGPFGPTLALMIVQWVSQFIALGIGIFALLKVTTPQPGQAVPPRGDRARRLTRWTLAALPISVLYGFVLALVMLVQMPGPGATPAATLRSMANLMDWLPWLAIIGFVMMLPYYVLPLSFLAYLRVLLLRIPHRSLAALARLEFWGCLVVYVFFTAGFVAATLLMPPFFRTLAVALPATMPAPATAPALGGPPPRGPGAFRVGDTYDPRDPNGPTLRSVQSAATVAAPPRPANGRAATLPTSATALPLPPARITPPLAATMALPVGISCLSLIGGCGLLLLLIGGVILIVGSAVAIRRLV